MARVKISGKTFVLKIKNNEEIKTRDEERFGNRGKGEKYKKNDKKHPLAVKIPPKKVKMANNGKNRKTGKKGKIEA